MKSNTISVLKFGLMGLLLALSLPSPAPINGYSTGITPPTMKNDSEKTLESQQNLQAVQGTVGTVPVDTKQRSYSNGSGDSSAQSVLSNVQQNISSPAAQAQAKQVLNEAQQKTEPDHSSPITGIALFFGIGLLSVFALKRWADAKIGGPGQSPV